MKNSACKRGVHCGIGMALAIMLFASASSAQAKDVTVGLVVPLTGELGAFGEIVASGIKAAVEEVNAAGGTKCGTITTVVADAGGDPQAGIRAATKMIKSQGAVAILGPTSPVMVALVDLAHRTKTVIMSPYAGTITLNELGGDFVYRTVSSDLGDGEAAGLWLADQGYDKVAFLVQNGESTVSPAEVARARVKEAGIEISDFVIYNPGQASYQAMLIRVLAHQPDAIFLAGGQQSGVTVIKEATAGGFRGEWLFTADLAVPEIFDAAGARLLNDRAYVEVPAPDTSRPDYKAFAELYKAKTGDEPGPYASNSFDMVNLVALALEASESCSGAAVNAAIRNISEGGVKVSTFAAGKKALAAGKDIDLEGASGPLTLDKTGTVKGSYKILAAEDGKWVQAKFYPAEVFE